MKLKPKAQKIFNNYIYLILFKSLHLVTK